MEERRGKVRVEGNLVVTYRVTSSIFRGGSRIKDISESGLCMPSRHYFPVDSPIQLEISGALKRTIKASARVVRIVNKADRSIPFEMGLTFLAMHLDDRQALQDYIKNSIARPMPS